MSEEWRPMGKLFFTRDKATKIVREVFLGLKQSRFSHRAAAAFLSQECERQTAEIASLKARVGELEEKEIFINDCAYARIETAKFMGFGWSEIVTALDEYEARQALKGGE